MIFETKVALVIRSDLASWQKMNIVDKLKFHE